MPPREDNLSSLERAKSRLYQQAATPTPATPLAPARPRSLPHAWKEAVLPPTLTGPKRHVRLATLFLGVSVAFFLIALVVAGIFFYLGGNSVSVNKIDIRIQGPSNISGGDTVPLSLIIVNKNPVAIDDATISIDFPAGTRDAEDMTQPYQRFTENLGTLGSGATVTRSVKAVVFGGAGDKLSLPVSLSYKAVGSNAVFVKKLTYELTISSTPLSVSVDTVAEAVAGQPVTLTLNVRSNATIPLEHVVVSSIFPFGFDVTSSSVPLADGNLFYLGTLEPGATKTIRLTGTLRGEQSEQRAFRFTVGTARSESDTTLAVTYMTQEATVLLTAPFISTTIAVNGDTSDNVTVSPDSRVSVTVSYRNTLATSITNAVVRVKLTGSAVDYASVQSSNGFYDSTDRSIVFSSDTDSSFSNLAPGATGVGSFTFATLPASRIGASPSITFSTAVSGTRVGQSNVPESISATAVKTVKVATGISFTAASYHSFGSVTTTGPIPPKVGEATTYVVQWRVRAGGSAIAGSSVSATLPSYITYVGPAGSSGVSYDSSSRTVTWTSGDIAQGASTAAAFVVSITPSSSQEGSTPPLTSAASFTGHDRFTNTSASATAQAVTTETPSEPGYTSSKGVVVP